MNKNNAHNIAIIIPTKNRGEYMYRQLKYYAGVGSKHPVYIGDSSTGENIQTIQNAVDMWKKKIPIRYIHNPELNNLQATLHLLTLIQEKYACIIGDDDLQIPRSLTLCAEFLENNPDFASAHGHAVAVRVLGNGVYGKIIKIKNYPQQECTQPSALERILDYFTKYYVTHFSVIRTEILKKAFSLCSHVADRSFNEEILDCSLEIAIGKSKLLDCLSFVRQIHDHHYEVPSYFDWITTDMWANSYKNFENILSQEIARQDGIPLEKAQKAVKQSFWFFLQKHLTREYYQYYPENVVGKTSIKQYISQKFPLLKSLYKKIRPLISKKKWLHAEVDNPSSPYYKDFQEIRAAVEHS